jgi:hypothetical protein
MKMQDRKNEIEFSETSGRIFRINNNMKRLSFLIVLLFLTLSCKDEVILKTPGEVNAEKIQDLIKVYNVTQINLSNQFGTVYVGNVFRIESPFLITNNLDYYNLDRLESLSLSSGTMGIQLR